MERVRFDDTSGSDPDQVPEGIPLQDKTLIEALREKGYDALADEVVQERLRQRARDRSGKAKRKAARKARRKNRRR